MPAAATDHGTSAPQFVMGGGVRGACTRAYPSLSDLQDGDLKQILVDFRNVSRHAGPGLLAPAVRLRPALPQRLGFLA